MNLQNKRVLSLLMWIFTLIFVGALIGSLTKTEVDTWYQTLNRSHLTPPNYVFGIVWTILYAVIAICGWIIWGKKTENLKLIKILYIIQLLLNWSWTPLFFHYHLPGYALTCLILILAVVFTIILLAYQKIKVVSFLFMPYFMWLLFAAYLNLYVVVGSHLKL